MPFDGDSVVAPRQWQDVAAGFYCDAFEWTQSMEKSIKNATEQSRLSGRGPTGQCPTSTGVVCFMKKTSLAVIGIAVLLVRTVSAQVLYTTTNDFSLWQTDNGFAQGPVTFPDSDGSIFNGLGNTNAPGGADTGGALSIQWPQGGPAFAFAAGSPGEQGF